MASEAKGRGFDPRQPHHHPRPLAMNDDELNQLRAQVLAYADGDKLTLDKRLKSEILLLRAHVQMMQDRPGYFACEGPYGRAVADQKEASLFETLTGKPLRWQPYKSHLVAVHSALCWSVLGISIG